MQYLLAALPIVVLLGLMMALRWGGQRAGPAGWLVGLAVAALAFGLNWDVLWVSQLKGLFLSLFVLAILWPALLLYNVVDQVGGIRALARGLEAAIGDRGLLLVVLAWAFSALLEGLAGFGLPIAIVAPMLVALGVAPVTAVAAVAVGHAWSVTFGDMGVIFQTLVGLTGMAGARLAPPAAFLLGIACLLCGLATGRLLGQGRRWPVVVLLGLLMSGAQYGLAVTGLTPLAGLGAGLAGVLAALGLGKATAQPAAMATANPSASSPALTSTLISYGALGALLAAIALIRPLYDILYPVVWQMRFPSVTTATGFSTPAGMGQALRPLVHPGSAILLTAIGTFLVQRYLGHLAPGQWRSVLRATWRSAGPTSLGIVSMVGLSTLMDHCGMTLLLAQALSAAMGSLFPLVSPLVGILGAFATGSNNNSNVLFASLQQGAAHLLAIDPRLLLAAQTAGGSLGSMLAPAKIIVGCSTVDARGQEGDVLRRTAAYGLGIGFAIGAVVLLLARS